MEFVIGITMADANPEDDDLRDEYDFSSAKRANYAQRYAQGSNVVMLDPDAAEVFPTARSVNEALRALAGIIRQHPEHAGG